MSPVTQGLAAPHRTALPVLERVICIPAVVRGEPAQCHHDRVYGDGARYLLTTEQWLSVNPVSSAAMTELEALYTEVCAETDPVLGNDDGSEIHLVRMDGCSGRLVVTGIPAGPLAPLREVPAILGR